MAQEYHSFKVSFAATVLENGKTIGVDNAIFLQDMAFWCDYNKSNGTNFHEGRYWTFSTIDGICERHPYWTKKQMRRIIDNCKELGLLIVGNFNKSPYDRTMWYSVSDFVMEIICPNKCETRLDQSENSICPNRQMENPKQENGTSHMGTPIQDNKIKYINKIQKEDDNNNNNDACAQDDGTAKVFSEYMNRIEPSPSPISMDKLKYYVQELGPDVCLRAIYRAIDNGIRKWSYIQKILQNCDKDGIRCLADWDAREEEREKRGGKNDTTDTGKNQEEPKRKWNLDCIEL